MKPTVTALSDSVGTITVSDTIASHLGIEGRALYPGQAAGLVNIERTTSWVRCDYGEWRVMLRVVPSEDGNPRIAELRMFPNESGDPREHVSGGLSDEEWSGCYLGDRATVPGPGITSKLLREAVKIPEAIRKATFNKRWQFAEHPEGGGIAPTRWWPRSPARRPKRGGRKPLKDKFLAELARTYVGAHTFGRYPIQATAKEHGIKDVRMVSYWVCVARRRELLTKTKNTAPGGQLTDKARRILGIPRARAPVGVATQHRTVGVPVPGRETGTVKRAGRPGSR